jgi:hypothetical protein
LGPSYARRRRDAVDPATLLFGRGEGEPELSSRFPRRRRAPCGAASRWRSPPHRPLHPRVDAASQSPRPAWTSASRRIAGPATSQLPASSS